MAKKRKTTYWLPLHAVLEIEEKDVGAFEEWMQNLPTGSHGPAISEWSYRVEIAEGVKANVKIVVPSWDSYSAAQKRKE